MIVKNDAENPPSFMYDFPKPGKHEFEVEVLKNSQIIAVWSIIPGFLVNFT